MYTVTIASSESLFFQHMYLVVPHTHDQEITSDRSHWKLDRDHQSS